MYYMTLDELTIASRRVDLWSTSNVIIHRRPPRDADHWRREPRSHIHTAAGGGHSCPDLEDVTGTGHPANVQTGSSLILCDGLWEYRTIKLHVDISFIVIVCSIPKLIVS